MREALSQWGYAPAAPGANRELERRRNLVRLRSAQQRAKTHCPHGHPYSPENTLITTKGARACRTCARIRGFRSYHKQNPTASYRSATVIEQNRP